jgi:hypothetical protein
VKIPMAFFTEIDKIIKIKIRWNYKRPWIDKTI